MENIVRVGVGVFVVRDGKFLIGKRKGAHGAGTWSLIGGHMEMGESIEQTAIREVMEETGVEIKNPRYIGMTNDNEAFKKDNRHYVNLYVLAEWAGNEPTETEPDKLTDLIWCDFETLPTPRFVVWDQLLKADFIEEVKKALKETSHDKI